MATSQVSSINTQGPVTIAYVKPTVNTHGLNPSPPSMNATVTSTPNQCYKVKAARITGAIQITCALASLISGVVILLLATCTVGDVDACSKYNQAYFDEWYSMFPAVIAWPIWGAMCFYAVAGGIGMCSANGRACSIVGYMVMSIIAAAVASGQVCMEGFGVGIHAEYCDIRGCFLVPGLPGMHGFAAAVAFIEMVVAIVAAAFCCHGVCSCCRGTSVQPVIIQYVNSESQIIQQGQGFLQEPLARNNQAGPTEEPRYVAVN